MKYQVKILTALVTALSFAAPASANLVNSADGTIVDIGLDKSLGGYQSSGNQPWVNARFKELGFPGYYGNSVELQITDSSLGAGGPFPVDGLGNLGTAERTHKLYLNFNPTLDITKLKLLKVDGSQDTNGLPGNFPDNGVEPATIGVQSNGFEAAGGLFDIFLEWSDSLFDVVTGERHVKLLFEYDGGNTDIDASDFAYTAGNSLYAAALISGPATNGSVSGTIGSVPEPGSVALLAATALGLVSMRRRR